MDAYERKSLSNKIYTWYQPIVATTSANFSQGVIHMPHNPVSTKRSKARIIFIKALSLGGVGIASAETSKSSAKLNVVVSKSLGKTTFVNTIAAQLNRVGHMGGGLNGHLDGGFLLSVVSAQLRPIPMW